MTIAGWLSSLAKIDPLVTALGVVFGVGAILNTCFQVARAAPRFFRYRLARSFFGFRNGQRVLIICSELEDAEDRQWVEPDEFIYMLKYGDLDALFGLVWLIREIYPRCRLEVLSSKEAQSGNIDYDRDLILIGGPDYNKVCERMLKESPVLLNYVELLCEGGKLRIGLAAPDREPWCGGEIYDDYGYIEVGENPFAKGRRAFFFGGCHTIGVTAATKVLQLNKDLGGGLTPTARDNLLRIKRFRRFRKRFCIVFRAALVGATIPGPSIANADFLGPPRELGGVPIGIAFLKLKVLLSRLR